MLQAAPVSDDHLRRLGERGWVHLADRDLDEPAAFALARALVDAIAARDHAGRLEVIGDFVLPPDSAPSRTFQTLHVDFGVPLDPRVDRDVARYTVLHVPRDRCGPTAVTRLVPLARLFAQRPWPSTDALIERFVAYGATHGAWHDAADYAEGSLARIVDAADGAPTLPSVQTEPGFLCGLEFADLRSELAFFERHGLRITDVQVDVALRPGELLVFDDLGLAHGRDGARAPAELRQWVFGHRRLSGSAQRALRDRWLDAMAVGHP